MDSLVIYATRTGNTRTIAVAIAGALREHGTVQLISAEEATNTQPRTVDLLVIGGPTEGHGMTEAMSACLDHLVERPLDGVRAAVFDTRLWWPKMLSGSAAEGIAHRLGAAGATIVGEPESFIVTMKPELQPGEVERAATWAHEVAATIGSAVRPAPGGA